MKAPCGAVIEIYRKLRRRFGPQGWWPGETPFEVIVGAILTQNTAWGNVAVAIANLKKARLLSARGLTRVPRAHLARLIRPSGYFNQKAVKLKAFMAFLNRGYGGSLARMGREPTASLRGKLLAVHGIGPETADSILLYAFDRPVFVVDAYTVYVLSRHGLISPGARYDEVQRYLTARVPGSARIYNEYHALFVRVGKEFCGKRPRCGGCPLKGSGFRVQGSRDTHVAQPRSRAACRRFSGPLRRAQPCGRTPA